jgi:flavin-binding protein dodecin
MEELMRMIRDDYERSGRNGHFGGMGMYDRAREPESDEMFRSQGPMRRGGRAQDTVRHASLVKVIEVLAESDQSWEDAANNALMEAQRSIRNIKSIYVKDMQAVVRDGRIRLWRLNAKISFAIEDHDGAYAHES